MGELGRQLVAFLCCVGLGMLFCAGFYLESALARFLRLAVVSVVLDVLYVGLCALASGLFMIWFMGSVSFFQFCAVFIGVGIIWAVLPFKRQKSG